MWHVEGFSARDAPGDLEAFLRDRFLPYFRGRGFGVRVFVTQASLGSRQFWLATEMERFADIDGWPERAGDEGAALIDELLTLTDGIQASVVAEL
ncbi:MAG: hypothetical protein IT337_06665 [Thermomicrobiales bacterium]|nr:hypothetical protein [Thermomicrobiales bacterium]